MIVAESDILNWFAEFKQSESVLAYGLAKLASMIGAAYKELLLVCKTCNSITTTCNFLHCGHSLVKFDMSRFVTQNFITLSQSLATPSLNLEVMSEANVMTR